MPANIYTILHLSSILVFTVLTTLFYLSTTPVKTWKSHIALFLILFSGIGLAHKYSIPLIGSWLSVKLIIFIAIAGLMGVGKRRPQYKQNFFYTTLVLMILGVILAVTQPF